MNAIWGRVHVRQAVVASRDLLRSSSKGLVVEGRIDDPLIQGSVVRHLAAEGHVV